MASWFGHEREIRPIPTPTESPPLLRPLFAFKGAHIELFRGFRYVGGRNNSPIDWNGIEQRPVYGLQSVRLQRNNIVRRTTTGYGYGDEDLL